MGHTLESYKIFPYVAWLLVVGFALFTYALTKQVEQELNDISSGIERLELKLSELQLMKTAPITQ